MKKIVFSIIVALINYWQVTAVCAYDNIEVHPAINEAASKQSDLDSFLKDLGFSGGITEPFSDFGTQQEALGWFKQGGKEEDSPDSRAIFHFHDPLKPWADAGLYLGYSALVWAQRGTADYPYPNHFSWRAARDYFYSALTTGQEAYYARTFRSIGQVMHLVSDMAVPAHVRKDAHLSLDLLPEWMNDRDPYEVWTKKYVDSEKINFNGLLVDQSIFDDVVADPSGSAPFPISALWDQDKYNLSNPDPSLTKSVDPNLAAIGLAEYTNANFFSKDSVFSADYPHPAHSDTNFDNIDWANPQAVDAEDGVIDNRVFIYGNAGGAQDIRLAAVGYLTYDCIQAVHSDLGTPIVDDIKVHEDYASRLIPRAVGYSTALIDYFFRGQIDMVLNEEETGLVIKNLGDENMAGSFSLYYDAADGKRYPVPEADWVLTIPGKDHSAPLTITFPTTPEPKNPNEFMLVFQGTMGNEEDIAVAGKLVQINTKEYVLVTLGEYCIVWDVEENQLATILDKNQENVIPFPSDRKEIEPWLTQSQPSLTKEIYLWEAAGETYFSNGLSSCTGCGDLYNTRSSYNYDGPITPCSPGALNNFWWRYTGTQTNMPAKINSLPGWPPSYNLTIQTDGFSGQSSCFRSESDSIDGWETHYTESECYPYVNDQYIDPAYGRQTEKYLFHSPIGIMDNKGNGYVLPSAVSYRDFYPYACPGNITQNFALGGWSAKHAMYSNSTMVQLYAVQLLSETHTYESDHMFGQSPDCPWEELPVTTTREFEVLASVNHCLDCNLENPTTQNVNTYFSNAVTELINFYINASGLSDTDNLTDQLGVSVRKEIIR